MYRNASPKAREAKGNIDLLSSLPFSMISNAPLRQKVTEEELVYYYYGAARWYPDIQEVDLTLEAHAREGEIQGIFYRNEAGQRQIRGPGSELMQFTMKTRVLTNDGCQLILQEVVPRRRIRDLYS